MNFPDRVTLAAAQFRFARPSCPAAQIELLSAIS
jgi:hypothetical protein